jgi:tRNA U34 5-carboxymethylaminomethyl modifying GTPase MnmE/TrmE
MACHNVSGGPERGSRARADLTIALAGNPNSGKSTVFNNLTGASGWWTSPAFTA